MTFSFKYIKIKKNVFSSPSFPRLLITIYISLSFICMQLIICVFLLPITRLLRLLKFIYKNGIFSLRNECLNDIKLDWIYFLSFLLSILPHISFLYEPSLNFLSLSLIFWSVKFHFMCVFFIHLTVCMFILFDHMFIRLLLLLFIIEGVP